VESNLGVQRNVEGAGGRVEQRARARAGVGAERRAPPGLRRRATALLLPLLLGACTTTRETTTTWEGYGPPERLGEVAWVRETVKDEQGNPVGGAVLGAAVGGLFGEAVGGHAPGALVGAAGGAAAGAALSKGSGEERLYDVGVRFEDGSTQVFRFPNASPFVVGERVAVSDNRLRPLGPVTAAPPPGPPPGYVPPPPPPPSAAIPPPP
jgi:outer membrane lipoprotein SlyB